MIEEAAWQLPDNPVYRMLSPKNVGDSVRASAVVAGLRVPLGKDSLLFDQPFGSEIRGHVRSILAANNPNLAVSDEAVNTYGVLAHDWMLSVVSDHTDESGNVTRASVNEGLAAAISDIAPVNIPLSANGTDFTIKTAYRHFKAYRYAGDRGGLPVYERVTPDAALTSNPDNEPETVFQAAGSYRQRPPASDRVGPALKVVQTADGPRTLLRHPFYGEDIVIDIAAPIVQQ